MAQFRISITATGGPHGCDRKAKPGEKLWSRCGRLNCPDCLALDFVQNLKQKGYAVDDASMTHAPGQAAEVVDDIKNNVRVSGEF